ncbi:MAG: acetyl-CoA C-acetyltransferase [Deltaproteobacteria bacterium]|nr:acetyl-CoA C-acetyltransferase [Deltaproteobacteria bacterium]
MRDVVIVGSVRTPIGDFNGCFKTVPAVTLGATAIEAAIERAGLTKNEVDEVIMGCVLPTGLGQNPARQAMIAAGLPMDGAAITVNKVCGSGLKAVMLGAQAIACGDADVIVAGGMENMNQAPYYLDNARFGYRMGNAPVIDGMIHDGIWDVVNDIHMGHTAELVTEKFGISREDMDRFAHMSIERTLDSIARGRFKNEIVPVSVPQRRGDPLVTDTDETPRAMTMEELARLRPAFKKEGGSVTAGNASKISDGAAAVVLMEREAAGARGLDPIALVGAQAAAGMELEDVLVTPIKSIPKVLKKAGLELKDIDLFEINEAFATSTVAIARELGIAYDKLNVNGGAVALGHPIGASGTRVLVTLLAAMQQRGAQRGMASLCLGGAEAVSLIVERL